MLGNNLHRRNEIRQTARRSNRMHSQGGLPAFDQVVPTCQSILDYCDITYLSNRIDPRELSRVRKLGAREAKAGIPSCDGNGVFTSPFTIAQYDVYLSDCHENERLFLSRQAVTRYGEERQGGTTSTDAGAAGDAPRENVSGTAAEGRARARQAAKVKAAHDAIANETRQETLICEKAGEADAEVLPRAFDRAKSIGLEYVNAYIAGAIEADARTKALARWIPLPWLRVRANRSRIVDAGASLAHVDWPDYKSSAIASV